ncbi:hypothetical protein CTEN210_06861 [Chaetoceros tenuissimus]|uniref:G-protein coupled receptors family 2 profile 2 domain-containing protein n=1 Tax=Chaetoceros tenuissimus TaxID=426638 RepID=A0AAD3CT58_9STRA|nr:hypothetical protein CTEN210_06861 [Chaetoceros tenuissimus]
MVPRGTSDYAVGNLATCDIQGFIQQVGAMGSILYNGSLSVYYLAVVTLNMKEKDIARRLELWLHLIPNGWAIATAIFLAAKRQYAPLGNQHVCWIGVYPQGCLGNPDVDCERGSLKTPLYAKAVAIIPFFITYFAALVITIIMLFTIVKQKRRADRWRMRERKESHFCRGFFTCILGLLGPKQNEQTSDSSRKIDPNAKLPSAKFAKMANSLKQITTPNSKSLESTSDKTSSFVPPDVESNTAAQVSKSRSGTKKDPLAFDVHKVKKKIRRESCLAKDAPIFLSNRSIVQKKDQPLRRKTSSTGRDSSIVQDNTSSATQQCVLYVSSFLLCWIFSATSRIYGIMGRSAPFPVLLLARIFAPLQGIFFILVYSRPHVRSLRTRNPELSWFQAFMIAFKAGGDNDSGGRNSIASNDLRVIDTEGIDAPRLTDAERQRRQENPDPDDDLNEAKTEPHSATDDLEVANTRHEESDKIESDNVDIENVAGASTVDIEAGQDKEVKEEDRSETDVL